MCSFLFSGKIRSNACFTVISWSSRMKSLFKNFLFTSAVFGLLLTVFALQSKPFDSLRGGSEVLTVTPVVPTSALQEKGRQLQLGGDSDNFLLAQEIAPYFHSPSYICPSCILLENYELATTFNWSARGPPGILRG